MPENEPRPHRIEMPEIMWIGENQDFLEDTYPGKWIAVKGRELIAVGDSLEEVSQKASAKGVLDPLVTGVRRAEYRGVIFIRKWL